MTDARAPLEFEEFYRAEHGRLARALYLLTGNAGEAEDLAQEAMARVFERWDRVGPMDTPQGYAYRTALNLYRSGLRRLLVRRRRTAESVEHDAIGTAEDRMDVHRAMQSLSREQREAVVLIEWLDLTTEDAGKILGIEPVSVRTRLHRAREVLREKLGEPDE
ncbi:MAG: sigma-70 family RNA polymerase sigma factor [Actinobacteria bacterium]|nr:sigma-70 family RNA polymerase sigma factor [Actinomycetota bacterium]